MRTTPTAANSGGDNNSHYVELLSSGHQDEDELPSHSELLSARRDASKRSYARIIATSFALLAGGLISLSVMSRSSTQHLQASSASLLAPPKTSDSADSDDAGIITSSVFKESEAVGNVASGSDDSEDDVPHHRHGSIFAGVSFVEEFEKFIQAHGKAYGSTAEKALRFEVFVKNLVYILTHNSKESSFKLAVNKFADMTHEEFKTLHVNGYHGERRKLQGENRRVDWDLANRKDEDLPASVDWRDKGCVAVPKDQKKCGSCWSFSTAGAVEGAYCLKHGVLYDLSEQQMVDCGFPEGNQGCNGGLMDDAFEYIIDAGGMCLEKDYPYTAKVGKCKDSQCKAIVQVSSFEDVPNDSEIALRAAVAERGPISVAIDADSMAFQFYKAGVFDTQCGNDLNHAVLLVGYGTEGGVDYWIVKNSWGPKWGDAGFIKMRRNTPELTGECGIQMAPSFPVVS